MNNKFLRPKLDATEGQLHKRLFSMNVDTFHCRAIRKELSDLKVPYESPSFRGKAVAHVLIPSAKLAIMLLGTNNTLARRRELEAQWDAEGWLGTVITKSQIERMIRGKTLGTQLAEAIKERRKKPKKTR